VKKLLLLYVVFVIIFPINPEELLFEVITESPYFSYNRQGEYFLLEGKLQKGDIVSVQNFSGWAIGYGYTNSSTLYDFNIQFNREKQKYITDIANIKPFKTQDLFTTDILFDYFIVDNLNIPPELWLPVYYCKVLESKERNTLVDFQPNLAQLNIEYDPTYGKAMNWYDYEWTDITGNMCMFFNAGIYFGAGNSFLIEKIIKTYYGYEVICVSPYDDDYDAQFKWHLIKPQDFETKFLFYVDGDYIDIYINDTEHLFATVVHVKEEFIRQYQQLIKTNKCDLTNVKWPRRADGNMDYPPSQLAQIAPKQPETVAIDIPPGEEEDTTEVVLAEETVAQQPGTALPLVIVLAAAGIAIAVGVVVFLIRRKR
jgi:hypothetical protein